ncbi:hypothetical protein MOX02_08220 [Methylobacterium oxalidis]|uniref:Uncharacterized protein n=1 Tax=Methylobacterium oxalidis TaxID=944322 RepID=A0A512IYJ8_9HYPH|nr:hypothetical protein MOX02_08220 [Methylobacterium oxalidis]GLS66816.1 hypothetical protein GCM10007888_51990 [Methylobacterium oxalidis]
MRPASAARLWGAATAPWAKVGVSGLSNRGLSVSGMAIRLQGSNPIEARTRWIRRRERPGEGTRIEGCIRGAWPVTDRDRIGPPFAPGGPALSPVTEW